MKTFWPFARRMLEHPKLLALGLAGALVSACSTVAGFGAILWLVRWFFQDEQEPLAEVLRRAVGPAWSERLAFVFDRIPAEPYHGLLALLGFVFVLTLIGATGQFVHQATAFHVVLRTILRIRKEAYHHLLHVPMSVTAVTSGGDLLSRIVRDCTQLARGMITLAGKALRDFATGVVFLAVAIYLDPLLTAIFVVGLIPIGVVIRKAGKVVRRASRRANRQFGQMTAAIQESGQSLAVVKVHAAEGYERRRFNHVNRRAFAEELRSRTARAFTTPAVETIAIAGVMAVTAAAGYVVFSDAGRDPGDMLNVLIFLIGAGVTLKPIAKLNNDIQESAAAGGRIAEVLALPVEASVRGGFKTETRPALPRHREKIRFEGVTFTYPGADAPALRGVSLEIPHGRHVAIVGPNGSGKTTLIGLIPRLHDPDAAGHEAQHAQGGQASRGGGRVTIDGHDVREVSLRSLRRQMALVTQQAVLFGGTIADNIAYGWRHASRSAIQDAARRAYAHDFVSALPHGYDTRLGEQGLGLSGGQKQRLCLARAILRDPAILLLDEATSQVDTDSEAQIQRALAEFRVGRTTLTIAHRLGTVIDADRIVVMREGRIIDAATHTELLERCELYRTLTQTQLQPSRA